ncbi:30S ribosomal protein S15 [Bacteriovoracaceae bacterium]|nr:30S ribosomal protein S15 [Bacteriovoracaceae bacterium]
MVTNERKLELTKKFGGADNNSGSSEVQVAILTERINDLIPHFEKNKHDYSGKRGLMKLIGRRRRLLRYLNGKDTAKYQALIKALGLRK